MGCHQSVATEDRATTMTELDEENIIDATLSLDFTSSWSICSNRDMNKVLAFKRKTTQMLGDKVDPASIGIGFACRKGGKTGSQNQDSWMVLKTDNYSFYCVFDGHGDMGHDISNYVKETLPKLILKDERFMTEDIDQLKMVLHDQFQKMQSLILNQHQLQKLDAKLSGTTATFCVHDYNRNKLIIAHVADSTAILGTYDEARGKLTHQTLTRDHKLDLEDEKARIEKAGGRIKFDGCNHRVFSKKNRNYPGLNMSRSLGDIMGHTECGLISEPEIMEHEITSRDHVLLLCSHGVWEFMSKDDALGVVRAFPADKAAGAADKLALNAWGRWIKKQGGGRDAIVDDLTVVLIYLQEQIGETLF